MNKYIASVYMTKHATKDNYFNGCATDRHSFIQDERFTIEFTDTKNLIEKLCEWTSRYFDIDSDEFMKHTHNEIENNRFSYSQNEGSDSNLISLTKEKPDGYLCDYDYCVEKVSEIINYKFDEISS